MFQPCGRSEGPSPSRRWQDRIPGDPYVKCPLQIVRRNRCFNCFSPRELQRCVGCNTFFYCDMKCRVRDWQRGHQVECPLLTREALTSALRFDESVEGDLRLLLLRLYSTNVMAPDWFEVRNLNVHYPQSFRHRLDIHSAAGRDRHDEETRTLCTAMANHINWKNPENQIDAYTLMDMAEVIRKIRFSIVDVVNEQQVGWGFHIVPHLAHEPEYEVIASTRGLRLQPLS